MEGLPGELEDNARAVLAIAVAAREDHDLSPARIQTLHEEAPDQIRRALEPFGHYRPAIETSLGHDGEDWTALWSESIDLANDDADVPRALAVDATAMLEVDAEAMQAWQQQWLDPRRGTPGWQWVVAGADADVLRRLSKLAPIEQLNA